jgi:hypothetical protein
MDDKPSDRRERVTGAAIPLPGAVAMVIAAIAGALAGAMAVSRLPADKFMWTGFVLVPLFVLVEVFVRPLAGLFGGSPTLTRMMLVSAIVAGFYGAWFLLRLH